MDTSKYFVVCTNVLGSCYGSTGPSSFNPTTQAAYGTDFPAITVNDMVRAQFHLLDAMGVDTLHASIGYACSDVHEWVGHIVGYTGGKWRCMCLWV